MVDERRGKYRDICPETISRVFAEQAGRHKSKREDEKAARAALHAISGAFMADNALKSAYAYMEKYFAGDARALYQALSAHASTRERLPFADALYERVFSHAKDARVILDLACGLNPIDLAARGHAGVLGVDAHSGCVDFINACAKMGGWDISARAGDLLTAPPSEKCDLALMMKLLPVLEAQKKGAAVELLTRVRARYVLVTFPTRTLSGRNAGMEAHYSRWFEANVPDGLREIDRFVVGNELAYMMERTDDGEIIRGGDADRQPERFDAENGGSAYGM